MTNQTQIEMIGQPVYWQNGSGWIAEAGDTQGNVYTIGAGGLQPNRKSFTIVWESGAYSQDTSEHIAAPWLARAAEYGIEAKTADQVADMLTAAKAKQAARFAQAEADSKKHAQAVSEWRDSIRDKVPAWAKAVIIAELVEDQSDSMTDYFGSTTTKTVILGFSKHTRDLFPEMRKAARNYEATAYLADAPDSAEHREKYSMGGGYYLKDGYRHRSGWKVSKRTFYGQRNDIAENVPYGEWAVPATQPAPERAKATKGTSAPVDGVSVSEHTHTKRGFQMWIVSPGERVSREEFMALLAKAKEAGGWYSRKWGDTPAGFAFKGQDAANEFAASL